MDSFMAGGKTLFKYVIMLFLAGLTFAFKPFAKRKEGVRVLIFHGVEASEIGQFRTLINRLGKDWDFISPEDFFAFMAGELKIKAPSLLVTFDDGFKSSAIAAREVLDKKGIKAIFFLISDFVGCGDATQIKKFASHNLLLTSEDIQSTDCTPMTSSEASNLLELGHNIASHSMSHARMSSLDTDDLEKEMRLSRDSLQKMLPSPSSGSPGVTEFAFPFGDIQSISSDSADIGLRYYQRLYTGCRGPNRPGQSGLILRDAVNLKDPIFYTDVYLSGIFDQLYKNRFKQLLRMRRA